MELSNINAKLSNKFAAILLTLTAITSISSMALIHNVKDQNETIITAQVSKIKLTTLRNNNEYAYKAYYKKF